MRHIITIGLAFSLLTTTSATADIAYIPWNTGREALAGRTVSANSQGFVFQVGCDGPTVLVPWRRGEQGAYFSRSSSCSDPSFELQLTAGVGFGGHCDDWRRGNFYTLGLLRAPSDKAWIATNEIQFLGDVVKLYDYFRHERRTIPMNNIGFMDNKDGVCVD